MTPEMIEHLLRVEAAIQGVKPLLARHPYPADLRTLLVIGLMTQMIEHHEGMLVLIKNETVGSACVLARSIFESMYRGLWINLCASDEQLRAFERDDHLPIKMPGMARAIDQGYHAEGLYEDLLNRCWPALCSYTHTGLLQLGRRFTGQNVQPSYTDAEVQEATTTVTTCILLLIGRFFAVRNYVVECGETEALIGTYGQACRDPRPEA
jgi:hypothetical protein